MSFIGDLAEHEEDLKVEKSCRPFKTFAPDLNNLISNFDLMCQALLRSKDKAPNLLIILYWYSLSFAEYLELKSNFFFLISIIDIL